MSPAGPACPLPITSLNSGLSSFGSTLSRLTSCASSFMGRTTVKQSLRGGRGGEGRGGEGGIRRGERNSRPAGCSRPAAHPLLSPKPHTFRPSAHQLPKPHPLPFPPQTPHLASQCSPVREQCLDGGPDAVLGLHRSSGTGHWQQGSLQVVAGGHLYGDRGGGSERENVYDTFI